MIVPGVGIRKFASCRIRVPATSGHAQKSAGVDVADPFAHQLPVIVSSLISALQGFAFSISVAETSTPMGSMLFTIMAALAQMEHEIKSERITDSISKRRAAGKNLGGRPQRITDSQIRSALSLIEGSTPAAQAARDLGISRATFYRRSRALADKPIGSNPPDAKRSQNTAQER